MADERIEQANREKVQRLAAGGMTQADISKRMGISEYQVRKLLEAKDAG